MAIFASAALNFRCTFEIALHFVMVTTTRRHAKYPRQLSEYAKQYGRSVESIKAWVRRGKVSGSLPPLDDREAMRGWWQEHMATPVPARFCNGNGHQSAPALAGPPPEPRDFSDVKSLSLEDNVEALRVTLAINKKLLDEGLVQSDEQTVGLRQRNYERCFNLLRLAEQSLTDLQKRRGELIERDKVIDDITKVVETLRLMRESMPRRVLSHFHGVAPEFAERLTQAITLEREAEDRIFRNLKLEGIAPKELTRLGLSGQKAKGDKENYE